MAGSSNGQNDIVWPGYVAAMASLLLSLLLVCAVLIMTIGQIGSINESYQQTIARIGFGAGQDIGRLAQIAGIGDTAAGGNAAVPDDTDAATAGMNSSQLLTAQFHSARFGRKADASTADAPLVLDLANGNVDREAARQAAALAAQDKQLLAQIDLSKVDIRKIKFNNLDFSGVSLHRGLTPQQMSRIDFSAVDFGNLTPDRVKKIKPLLAKEAVLYQIELQKSRPRSVATPPQSPPRPVVAPAPAVVSTPPPAAPPAAAAAPSVPPDQYRIVFSEETTDLSRAQKAVFTSWVDNIKASGDPVRVWTEIPTGDDFLKRSAFARLQILRGWLIDAGVPAERVRIALQNSNAATLRDLTVHIEIQKR